jgi:hypothetical protein
MRESLRDKSTRDAKSVKGPVGGRNALLPARSFIAPRRDNANARDVMEVKCRGMNRAPQNAMRGERFVVLTRPFPYSFFLMKRLDIAIFRN